MTGVKKDDLPAMPFYVGDWLKCPEVRALPLDYRALWFDMLCFMWESTERGVMIKSTGEPYSDQEIVRMVGLDNQNSGIWLTSLLTNAVCCRRKDGAIYSKRMVRNEEIRQIRAKSGSKGGNPNLMVNHLDKQKVNQKPEYENENENDNGDEVKPTIPKKTTKPLNTIAGFFYQEYEKAFGEKYVASFSKDGALLKEILTVLPETRVKELIVSFFQSKDEFIQKTGYTVGVFKSQINKLKNPTTALDQIYAKAGLRKE